MKTTLLFFLAVAAATATATAAQPAAILAHDIPGTYEKRAAQGLAIYKDTAFLLSDRGYCRIYNLKTRKQEAAFELATFGAYNHANAASFGAEFPKGNAAFPALYIAQCREDCLCFVESIDKTGSWLVQTIGLKINGHYPRNYDWVADAPKKHLYAIAPAGPAAPGGAREYYITKLPLPPLPPAGKNRVEFTEKDILDRFTIAFPNLLQGATILGDRLYLPVGGNEKWRKPSNTALTDRAVIVVNLATQTIEQTVPLNAALTVEPEDAAFHNNDLLMYCGQEGGLWKINGI